MVLVSALFLLIRSLIAPRTSLVAENLALRQQLAVLNRKIHRPQLRRRDRFFWVILSQLWKNWREVLIIVKPETVIKWHRQGFRLYWRWKSKAPVGRPKIDKEIRELIGKMSRENPLWGVPRLQAELHLLGYDLTESTVAKYRVIREWALHRQDGIFGTDTAVFLSLSSATLFLFLSLLFSFVLTSPDAAEDG
jgi:putative transposase